MDRRRFLEIAAGSSAIIAGCSGSGSDTPTNSTPSNTTPTASPSRSPTDRPTETETASPTETPQNNPDTIFVGPDGEDGNPGTKDAPVRLIQHAVEDAMPGDTVYLLKGQYFQRVGTKRPGEPDAPITITGPPEAIVSGPKGEEYSNAFSIKHSHIQLTGISIDGLQDPEHPNDPTSYARTGIHVRPIKDEYLKDLVIKPSRIGNFRGNMIKLGWVENVEVGEFQVIGPSGVRYLLTDKIGHWGEIVYVGTSPLQELNEPGGLSEEFRASDESNNIHIHHIDNSAGHGHSEIVNTKMGTYDVLVEYCTDGGGSQNTESYHAGSVNLQSYGATVRWCDLRNGHGDGVKIGDGTAVKRQEEKPESELTEGERLAGTKNSIYGNRVTGFDDYAFRFPRQDHGQTPDAQRAFCDNKYDGPTDGNPDKPCGDDIPTSNGIGHLGGDSPWV